MAQEVPGDLPATQVDDIVVEGRPLDAVAESFVEAVSAPARTRGMARWEGVVCIGVVGFRAEAARLIIDRMSDVARSLKIDLAEPGCDPNLIIAAATDGKAMADELVRRHQQHFFRFGDTRSNAGGAALEAFRTSDAAVRWWHVSLPVNVETGLSAIALDGGRRASIPGNCTIRRNGAEYRSCEGIADRLMRLIIVVDVSALPALSFDQLADYLTMIGLAQIDPAGDWSEHDTVLNVLADPSAATQLTRWDLAYLGALYSGEQARLDTDDLAEGLADRLR